MVSKSVLDYDGFAEEDEELGPEAMWLRSYNLESKLSETDKWSDDPDDWFIAIPYDPEHPEDVMKKTYSKLFGVVTAEDGVHKNIIYINYNFIFIGQFLEI